MKNGTAFFQNLEQLNISDLSSITSIISLIIGLIPTQCDRTAPGGNDVTTFVPFLGSTTCDITDSNPLGNLGSCGSFSSGTGGAGGGVAAAANAVSAIVQQADAYLTTVNTHLSGYNESQFGTPGRQALLYNILAVLLFGVLRVTIKHLMLGRRRNKQRRMELLLQQVRHQIHKTQSLVILSHLLVLRKLTHKKISYSRILVNFSIMLTAVIN